MRVLFTIFAASVHSYAQVPLAWALRAAGHEVRVASQPDLTDVITGAGLTAVPVGASFNPGERMKEVMDEQDRTPPEEAPPGSSWETVLDITELRTEKLTHDYMQGVLTAWTTLILQYFSSRRMIDDLVGFARDWRPDLVIWDAVTFAGSVAARVSGAANARMLFGLDLLGAMRGRYLETLREMPPEAREDPLAEWLGWTLERYGHEFGEDLVLGDWTIDPCPPGTRLPVDHHHYVPMRHIPYNGPAMVPEWLREPPKRPRVCLTRGLSHREPMAGDPAPVAELLEAVADLDVEVVATLDDRQLATVGSLPDNIRTVEFVPLNELMPTCSAIVHQGGFGTLQSAIAHGVPHVVVPGAQWDNALMGRRLEEAGAGLCARDSGRLTARGLREMLERVLEEPSFAANADRLRTETLGTPAPSDLVPVLEKLTAESRSNGPRP